jgi:hypothetical protein
MGSWRDMKWVLARETVKSDIVLDLLCCGAGVPNFHNIIPKGFRITVVENPLPLSRVPTPLTHTHTNHTYCTSGTFRFKNRQGESLPLANSRGRNYLFIIFLSCMCMYSVVYCIQKCILWLQLFFVWALECAFYRLYIVIKLCSLNWI